MAALVCVATGAVAATATNPRGTASGGSAPARSSEARVTSRMATNGTSTSRTARERGGTIVSRAAATISGIVRARAGSVSRAAANGAVASRSARVASNSTGVARSAVGAIPGASHARSATNTKSGMARAGLSRATAVFSDISKIGGGYAACRESYATCMDQFCASANDSYRRCFCSSRYLDFRKTEDALDQATLLLMQFQDNNLNAVDKTAAEVNAMYTATAGELAIKKDTSAAAKMLADVSDLLSGKKRTTTPTTSGSSMGILSIDFSSGVDDIWGGTGGGLFGDDAAANLSSLEGEDLYKNANKQCLSVMGDMCDSSAVLNMATSSYGILITQDCNLYEKNLDSKRESVQQTVRTAEKYLREARLEEYRTHNSADVNECLDKVRTAIQADVACGTNYKRCLDYSGAYINQTTGEPIYSTRLFQLTEMIKLDGVDGSMDVLGGNVPFNDFLDSKRMFAATALDTCRDMADIVWSEFKRSALIEIAQAQDEKIEEVKMSCVSTMKECYDTQSGALKSFDDTTVKVTGALTAYAAKAMCEDKVIACAALYGGGQCNFGKDGKLTADSRTTCGLSALIKFVNSVDNVRVAEGCATAIDNHLKDLCTPKSAATASGRATQGYPWNCRNMKQTELEDNIQKFADSYCGNPTDTDKKNVFTAEVTRAYNDVLDALSGQLASVCMSMDGFFVKKKDENNKLLTGFYTSVYGNSETDHENDGYGVCVQNNTMVQCLALNSDEKSNDMASYNRATDECNLTEEWYRTHCAMLGNGYYENGVCYVAGD